MIVPKIKGIPNCRSLFFLGLRQSRMPLLDIYNLFSIGKHGHPAYCKLPTELLPTTTTVESTTYH